jgi:phage major head subunit gpT-like protein
MLNTVSLDKVVLPGIKKHWVDGYKEIEPQFKNIFKIRSNESKTDITQNYTGLGDLAVTLEGGVYQEDSPFQSFGSTYTPVKYGRLVKVTRELEKYAKTDAIFNRSKMLGKATSRHIDKRAANMLINAFNTAQVSYSDGKPLASTSHTSITGSAQSNASGTSIALSDANLEVGLLALENQKDDRNQLIDVMGSRLVIPSALKKTALVITKSEKKSGTEHNDANVYNGSMSQYYGGLIDVMVWKYLGLASGGSDTMWMLEDVIGSLLTWSWGFQPSIETDSSAGFTTDTTLAKGGYSAALGWDDWRSTWFSKGDGTTYSS